MYMRSRFILSLATRSRASALKRDSLSMTSTQSFHKDTKVKQVDAPSYSSRLCTLTDHVPILTGMKPGVVSVREKDSTIKNYMVAAAAVTTNKDSSASTLSNEGAKVENIDTSTVTSDAAAAAAAATTNDLATIASQSTPKLVFLDTPVEPLLTGAIIPLSQQSFIQWLFLPYTFAVMYYMDFLIGYMPWWVAIAATTVTCKIAFFPLLVKQQIISAKTHNLMPETQKIQAKMNEAMVSGDSYKAALNKTKLKLLYDEHGLSISERLWPALIQAPMFMSLFFLLRNLTSQPVESMTTGGALWFQNLTIPDPYFVLPIMTCTSMFLLMELSMNVEGVSAGPIVRWAMRCMPLGLFYFVYSFPAATLVFWTTNNLFSLAFSLFLRHPLIRKKVGIPERLVHDPSSLPLSNMSLLGQLKSAKEMGQASKTSLDIRRLDDIAFKKAGVGPLRKTYSSPPRQ